MKTRKQIALCSILVALALLGAGLFLTHRQAQAMPEAPNYDVLLESAAPNPGRPAPYGQWIVTHNGISGITTTVNYGSVAKTAGYDRDKALFLYNSGAYTATVSLYARTSSTGSLYEVTKSITNVNPGQREYLEFSKTAPWLTLAITSTNATTGTTMLAGIYVQTP